VRHEVDVAIALEPKASVARAFVRAQALEQRIARICRQNYFGSRVCDRGSDF
jgi:hypothetical protein